jgi:Flp pilus assembly pilin Flp
MRLIIGVLRMGGSYERRDCDTRPRKRAVGNPSRDEVTRRRLGEKGEAMPRLRQRKGQGLVEYILIVALMGVLAIAAVNQLSDETQNGYDKATKSLRQEFRRIG